MSFENEDLTGATRAAGIKIDVCECCDAVLIIFYDDDKKVIAAGSLPAKLALQVSADIARLAFVQLAAGKYPQPNLQ